MTKKHLASALLSLALINGVSAQDSTKSLTFSGSVDAYYRYNFNAPSGKTNNYTSFTNSQNSFELGMAELRVDGSALSGKVTATADLGFGRRAEEFSYTDGAGFPLGGGNGFTTLAPVQQLFISFTPGTVGKGVKFSIGKWATHMSYEVANAPLNRNYSMDYMFTYQPFNHTGIKAEYTKDTWGFMIGIANPTDNTTTISGVKTLIAQISDGTKNGKVKVFLNYQGFFGANHGTMATSNVSFNNLKSLNHVEVVGTALFNPKWNIGFHVSTQFRTDTTGESKSWWGSALYINYDPSSKIGLTLRSEYISDNKLSLYASKSIYDVTLSLNYKVGPITIIPELRFDAAESEIFNKKDGTGSKSTATGLLAAVYKF